MIIAHIINTPPIKIGWEMFNKILNIIIPKNKKNKSYNFIVACIHVLTTGVPKYCCIVYT